MAFLPTAPRLGRFIAPTRKPSIEHQSRSTKPNSKPESEISNVLIRGEGYDELKKRYFKFQIEGRPDGILIIPVDNILDRSFLKVLARAGASVFSSQASSGLLQRLQQWRAGKQSFVVATKLGWIRIRQKHISNQRKSSGRLKSRSNAISAISTMECWPSIEPEGSYGSGRSTWRGHARAIRG